MQTARQASLKSMHLPFWGVVIAPRCCAVGFTGKPQPQSDALFDVVPAVTASSAGGQQRACVQASRAEAARQATLESKVRAWQQQLASVQATAEQLKGEYSNLESHHQQVTATASLCQSVSIYILLGEASKKTGHFDLGFCCSMQTALTTP